MQEALASILSRFGQQVETGSRSDVLRPLAWLLGLQLTALVSLAISHAAAWLLLLFGGSSAISAVAYFIAYFFCLFRDRDALRSERYALNKMAIEHGVYGDSLHGIVDQYSNLRDSSPTRLISEQSSLPDSGAEQQNG